MDTQTSAYTTLGAAVMIIGSVLMKCNHKRIRSTCCKRNIEASIDIENTTPPTNSKEESKPSNTQ